MEVWCYECAEARTPICSVCGQRAEPPLAMDEARLVDLCAQCAPLKVE